MARGIGQSYDLPAIIAAANERLGEVVETRYVLFEVTPAAEDNGYWGEVLHPAKYERMVVSDRLRAISDFQDTHEPDPGRHFEVYEEELRERVVRDWRTGRKVWPV